MKSQGSRSSLSLAPFLIVRIIIITLALMPARAYALQPLGDFLRSAAQRNFDDREARATAVQRVHEASEAWSRLLPSVTIQGDAIRNQYLGAANIPTGDRAVDGILPTRRVIITPVNQWDASFAASMPLIDVAARENAGSATASRDAQQARVAATALEVQKTVARTYYQLVGATAVSHAARRTLAAAQDNARYIDTRARAGLALQLDAKRAIAEVERDRQAIEDADYTTITLRRSLATLTGLTPDGDPIEDSPSLPADDLHDEPPLVDWNRAIEDLPSVRAAVFDHRAADLAAAGAFAAMYPTLSAHFTERATNAFGFGQSPYYTAQILLTWNLDRATHEAARAQRAAAVVSAVRYDRARATASDTLFNDWQNVRTQIAKLRAARSSLDASNLARSVARDNYGAGRATLLDVVQAERDAFSAEVTEIQAEADLVAARASLRLSAGQFVETP